MPRPLINHPDQYVFDFTSRQNERCALLQQLREVPIEMGRGRIDGVIELLQRLTLFARHVPETLSHAYTVDAQVTALAARFERRRTVSERTIRSWTQWAKELGILDVQYTSRDYGGHRWNVYTVNFARVLELLNFRAEAGGSGRKRAEATAAPGAEATADLKGGSHFRPVFIVRDKESTHSLTPAASSIAAQAKPARPDDSEEVVVSALVELSMSRDGAQRAVRTAMRRGLSRESIDQLVQQYLALTQTDPRATIGWLYRWLTGQSSPPKPKPPASPPRVPRPTIDRAAYHQARQEAVAIAAGDVPMAEQLRRLQEARLSLPAEAPT